MTKQITGFGQCAPRLSKCFPWQRPQALPGGFALGCAATGTAPCALPCACLGIAPRGIPGRGCAPARRHPFGTRQKDAKARQRAFPPLASPLGAAGQRPEESRAGSFVKQSAASARRTHPVWRKRQPGLPGRRCRRAFQSLRANSKERTRSNQAPVPPLAGSPRVMPASSLPSPACPRSSALPRA